MGVQVVIDFTTTDGKDTLFVKLNLLKGENQYIRKTIGHSQTKKSLPH